MTEDERYRHSQHDDQSFDRDLDELSSPPSNKKLLCIAFVSFQSFAVIQIFVALYAESEAMLGDSMAMVVDALTYLFNLVAERQKEIYASELKEQCKCSSNIGDFARSKMVLKYRKFTYQLELIPPLISVSALTVITVIVLKQSIHTLILDSQRDASLQTDPNVNLMVLFSFFNLLLDVLNVGCFASASHAFGYETDTRNKNQFGVENRIAPVTESIKEKHHSNENEHSVGSNHTDEIDNCDDDSRETNKSSAEESFDTERIPGGFNRDDDHAKDGENDDSANLNMCSAYTHVFADTLRSFAVILASLLAKLIPSITSEVADATAAVVVSILIFLSLLPLIWGMIQTFKSLKDTNRLLKAKESDDNEEEDQVELLQLI